MPSNASLDVPELGAPGQRVWLDFGAGEPVEAIIVEDRGAIGSGGRRILQVALVGPDASGAGSFEVPANALVPPPSVLEAGAPTDVPPSAEDVPKRILGGGVHVLRDTTGNWRVEVAGRRRSAGVFKTQREAINQGRELAKRHASELYVHDASGRIKSRDTYGRDLSRRTPD